LVTQVGSVIGEKPKTVGAMRALGLRGIGQTRLQRDCASTWGSINRVRHLVYVEVDPPAGLKVEVLRADYPLGAQSTIRVRKPGRTLDSVQDSTGTREERLTVSHYKVEERDAVLIRVGRDELAKAENYDGYFSVNWTTSLRARLAIEAVVSSLKLSGKGQGIVIRRDNNEPELIAWPTDELSSEKRGDDLVNLVVDDYRIVWRQLIPAHKSLFQLGVVASHLDGELLRDLLQNTASRHVVATVPSVLGQIADTVALD
jgi:ribosomal protein L30